MFDDIDRLKERYAHQIEDGRKVAVFTTMPEWQFYIERVLKPTIEEYTHRIITGEIKTDKEDYILRGMIQGLQLVIDSTTAMMTNGEDAKKKAKALVEYENE